MKRFKTKNNKVSKPIYIVGILILFLTFVLISYYNNHLNPRLIEIARMKLLKFTESFLSNNVGYDMLKDYNLNDLLIINKNRDDEILYVDYDLSKSYEILNSITKELNELITNLESGIYHDINDKNIQSTKYGLVIKLPMLIASQNALFANLGPPVYMNVNFIGALLTNIKTKITDYGMNNALVELYVTIKINEEIISPVTKEESTLEYDVLIASKVINGRVPELYGGYIETKSNILSIPME